MTRVILRNAEGMKLNGRPPSNISGFSDDEDAVHSGSATAVSDADPTEYSSQSKLQKHTGHPFDPVNNILDKIDAELVSLTRSQSSTATDSTVVHRPRSQPSSADHSRLESGEGLSISQLGSIQPRSFSPPAMLRTGSSDRDTGFGSYDSLQHRRAPSPEMVYKDGRHVYQNGSHGRRRDDDKSSRGPDAGSAVAMDSKQVDDKFKEIMQKKRKGGYKSNEDAETIRTEDFVEKFQDTLVYSSADEQDRLKNLDEDVSDGGWDTDTIQRKLAILTNTPLPEDRSFARPLRSLEQQRKKLVPLIETRAFKGTQGTPPVYPKPTPTSSLPRPSRGGVRMSTGFASDADSVKTEDFESNFNNMMVNQGGETSDPDTATNDPIHARVKQLLKATAKYEDASYNQYSYPLTTSILKQSYSQDKPHRGPEPFRSKQHVRIDSSPRQFEEPDKGEDSDDTLCSDKDATRKWQPPAWDASKLPARFSLDSDPWEEQEKYRLKHIPLSNVSSGDESFSKSSSQSSFSISSNEKEKAQQRITRGDQQVAYIGHPSPGLTSFSRQLSTASSAVSSSTSASDYPSSDYVDTANASRSTSTSESMIEDSDAKMLYDMQMRYRERDSNVGRGLSNYFTSGVQNSNASDMGFSFHNSNSKPQDNKNGEKSKRKNKDLIVPDEEEEFPFAKYTFNKKPDKTKPSAKGNYPYDKPFMKDSVDSKRLMEQYMYLHGPPGKRLTNSSSSSSLFSSMTSNSFTDTYSSPDDLSINLNESYDFDSQRGQHGGSFSSPGLVAPKLNHMLNNIQNGAKMVPGPYPPYLGMDLVPPPSPVPMEVSTTEAEQVLARLGFGETQNFLPERFLRSWVNKMVQSQQREREMLHQQMLMIQQQQIQQHQQQLQQQQQQYYHYPESCYDDNDLPPSVSAQQSGHNTPKWRQSLENLHAGHPPTARQRIGHRRIFRRAQSFGPMLKDTSSKFNQSIDSSGADLESEKDFGSIGALPVKKENSYDKLKRILQNSDMSYSQEVKRNQYSTNRQNSLPLFLETLSEEDEAKSRSRSPSVEKVWDSNNLNLSHMKNFFQEEERKSSTENSRKSSIVEPKMSEVISGIKEALEKSEDLESLSSSASSHSNIDKKSPTVPEKVNHILQLPSIIVSEREDSDHGSPSNIEIETNFRPASPRTVSPRPLSPRPLSPTPDNQKKKKKHEDAPSKDSLEIAEILGTTERRSSLKSFVPTLTTISSPGISSKGPGRRRSLNETNSNFLRIVSDFDDKCLSPSSTASPLELSPVTVIELTKLDNQNDSIETEDSIPKVVDSEGSVSKGSNKKINIRKKMGGSPVSRKQPPGSLRRHSAGPKILALERRSYERDDETAEENNVFEEEEVKTCNDYVEKEIQTMDDSLPPIVNICDIPTVLERLLKKLPEHGGNLFYLAQDKGTQYEVQPETCPGEANPTKVDSSPDTVQEDSDKLDSGFTSNQGSNESMLSPMQGSSQVSNCSNPESDIRETQRKIDNLNNIKIHKRCKGSVANSEAKQIDLPLVDSKTSCSEENCETKTYRSEAFLIIGKPTFNDKNESDRINNTPKQQACDFKSEIIDESVKTDTYQLPSFASGSVNQSTKQSKFLSASPQKRNDTHGNGNKKIVHFSMTDSQEENENKKTVNLKRLEKNRTKFHDLKTYSFDRRRHKKKNTFGEKVISKSYETYLSGASDSSDGQPMNFRFFDDFKPGMDNFGVIDDSATETESEFEMSYESDMSENESTNTSMLVNFPNEDQTSRSLGDLNTESENTSLSDIEFENVIHPFGYFGSMEDSTNSIPSLGEIQKSLSQSDEHQDRIAASGFHQVEKFGKHYAWRSLDFGSLKTRRAILQTIGGHAFSKSYDTGSSSMTGSASSLENIPEETLSLPVLPPTCEDFIKEFRGQGDIVNSTIKEEEKLNIESHGVVLEDYNKIKDIPNTEALDTENTEKLKLVDNSLSEGNKAEKNMSEFLDIDLSEIDKYCDISDIQVLDNIDEETDELEKFIDSYVEISHENMKLHETEYDETEAVSTCDLKSEELHIEPTERHTESDREFDENKVMNHGFKLGKKHDSGLEEMGGKHNDLDLNEILDDYVIVENGSAKEPGVKMSDLHVDDLMEKDQDNLTDLPSETGDDSKHMESKDEIVKLKEEFAKHTYKNVKIKTFQLGKNSINMRTFGNYSTQDKGKIDNVQPVKVQISVTDTDSMTTEIINEEMPKLLEDDGENAEQYSEEKQENKTAQVKKESEGQITNESSLNQEHESDKTDIESEKRKKIKELYKSFSYGDFDAMLNELDLQDDDSVQKLSERFDRNVTFEEVFAQNFEYLEHDYIDGEHNNKHEETNTDSQANGDKNDNKDSPHVSFVTHHCLNCGYKVTLATHDNHSYQEDHDYCVKCSPLDLSVEVLERKRLARHNENSTSD